MKKILCGALALLTLTAVFTSCDKKDKNNSTELKVSETSIKMALTTYNSETGDDEATSYRISVTPKDFTYTITAEKEGVVSWKISKNTITLTAEGIGSTELTIASTSTDQTATVLVNVVSELEALDFSKATISYFNGSEYLATLDTVDSVFSYKDEAGDTQYLRAFLVDATLEIYSDGLYINNDGVMEGSDRGYVAYFPAKAYYAPEGMNDDRGWKYSASVSTGAWTSQPATSKQVSHVLQGGYLATDKEAEAIEHVKSAIEYYNAYMESESEDDLINFQLELMIADTIAFHGAHLVQYTYSAYYQDYTMTFMPAAIINAGMAYVAYDENSSSNYMYEVPSVQMYMNQVLGDNGWGVNVERNEITNSITLLSKNFEIDQHSIEYKRIASSESAPVRMGANQFDKHVKNFIYPRNAHFRTK